MSVLPRLFLTKFDMMKSVCAHLAFICVTACHENEQIICANSIFKYYLIFIFVFFSFQSDFRHAVNIGKRINAFGYVSVFTKLANLKCIQRYKNFERSSMCVIKNSALSSERHSNTGIKSSEISGNKSMAITNKRRQKKIFSCQCLKYSVHYYH